MAQNKSKDQEIVTVLTISNEEFKKQLDQRIKIGEELCSREIANNDQLDSLNSDYSIWNDYNSEYLKQKFNNPKNEYRRSYADAGYTMLGQMGEVPGNRILTLINLIKYKINSLITLKNKSELIKSEVSAVTPNSYSVNKEISKINVFIVHGHDNEAKIKTARFIEKLGFVPIILHEQTSSGKTIIEKIEEYSDVGFGIVLYTPCDVGAAKSSEHNLKFRARQNVVFEHGFLIGKIGRENVCALVKNELETPNDISGVVYIKMDEEDAWHLKIAKELRSSGYDVDMNKL